MTYIPTLIGFFTRAASPLKTRTQARARIRAEKEGLKNIRIIHSSANDNIKLSDKSVDHVLLLDVLQEISNKNRIFEEVRRVLRFGGTVTVFPMHIDYSQVIKLAEEKDLKLQSRKFDDRVLVFRKNTPRANNVS
jgi:ubiquinone/menaquinone biosynthesis C-methylase UbiE